jgi:hypothetical protein
VKRPSLLVSGITCSCLLLRMEDVRVELSELSARLWLDRAQSRPSPAFRAFTIAAARSETCSFVKMFET